MNLFQQLEQFQSTLRDITPILWGYYNSLKNRGFSDEQAFTLVRDMHRMVFRQEGE